MTLTISCFLPSNTHSAPLEGNCILAGVAEKLGLPFLSAFQQENSILRGISWRSVGLTAGYSMDRQRGYGKTQSGAKTTVTSRDCAGPGCTLWGETPEVSPCRGSRLHQESPAKHANPLHKVAVKRPEQISLSYLWSQGQNSQPFIQYGTSGGSFHTDFLQFFQHA